MTTKVAVKRGDVGVVFEDTLTSGGVPVDLTGATVRFILSRNGASTVRVATVVNAAAGTVSYAAVAGDLATAGEHRQEWEVTWPAGQTLTYPSDGWNRVLVLDDLNTP